MVLELSSSFFLEVRGELIGLRFLNSALSFLLFKSSHQVVFLSSCQFSELVQVFYEI